MLVRLLLLALLLPVSAPRGRGAGKKRGLKEVELKPDGTKRRSGSDMGSWVEAIEPMHKTVCDGRPCRPGEGNLKGYEHWKQPYEPPSLVGRPKKTPPLELFDHSALVAAARPLAQAHRFVVFAAADYDYREMAENWYLATKRAGMANGLVYCLDSEAYIYLTAKGVPSANGTANMAVWSTSRLVRHIQRALAERHMALAALVAAGLDALMCDTSHVFLKPVAPFFERVFDAGGADMYVQRSRCNADKVPYGCQLSWNFVLGRGSGPSSARRNTVVSFIRRAMDTGMVDFYLRWWAGHHCIFMGYQKTYKASSPSLDGGLTPQQVAAQTDEALAFVSLSHGPKIGMLPTALFPPPNTRMPASLIARSEKHPDGEARHRLRLDRYDEVDFDHLRAAMVKDGLWFLGAPS